MNFSRRQKILLTVGITFFVLAPLVVYFGTASVIRIYCDISRPMDDWCGMTTYWFIGYVILVTMVAIGFMFVGLSLLGKSAKKQTEKKIQKSIIRNKPRVLIVLGAIIASSFSLYVCFFVPIDSSVGVCSSSTVRLSVLKGEQSRMAEFKQAAYNARIRLDQAKAGLKPGVTFSKCPTEVPTYNLYVF